MGRYPKFPIVAVEFYKGLVPEENKLPNSKPI